MTERLDHAPSLEFVWLVAFSGHRPKTGDAGRSPGEISACHDPLKRVLAELQTKAEEAAAAQDPQCTGRIELVTGVAEGADQLAVKVAKELGIPVHIILPMSEGEFCDDFRPNPDENPNEAWSRALQWITEARSEASDWTLRIAQGDHTRPGCYHDANLQMLESADVVIAICRHDLLPWESDDEPTIGSAASVLKMAATDYFNLPSIVLDPAQGGREVHRADWNPTGDPEARLSELNGYMQSNDALWSPPDYQRTGDEEAWSIHQALDNVANNYGRKYRGNLEASIWYHFFATTLAASAATYAKMIHGWTWLPLLFTLTEFVLVLLAWRIMRRERRAQQSQRWRRSRFGAELADSQLRSAGLVDPLRPLVLRHDHAWKRFALSLALRAHRDVVQGLAGLDPARRLETLKSRYLEKRIEDQMNYLENQQRKAKGCYRCWHWIGVQANQLAILVIAIALVTKMAMVFCEDFEGWGKNAAIAAVILFGPIFLPLAAGLSSSVIAVRDAGRRRSRYAQLHRRLTRFKRLLPTIRTPSAMQRVVTEAEDIMLDENIEWHTTASTMGHGGH